jgi:Uma2 family endonuclease
MSPSDRLKTAQKKMEEWLRAGIKLGWLIQPDAKMVFIYRVAQTGAEGTG